MIPYAFSVYADFQTVIVTAQREEYTYLNNLPGLVVDIVPAAEDWTEFAGTYIEEHYEEIDVLFCFGSYPANQRMVPLYRRLRPDGQIVLKLDANIGWMDRISISDPEIDKMYRNCDVITCESHKLQKYLSARWPYQIDYMVNGYLEGVSEFEGISYEQKENIILTVGRIGTEQKANHILLQAFAQCAGDFPDWSVRLVGAVEPAFWEYVEQYKKKYPQVDGRVIFTGKILDRESLNEEYKKAKVFVVTSLYEGGTPNVFSEAAGNGCYMVCSEIDAAEEFTNHGTCGRSFPLNDADALTRIFREVLAKDFEMERRKAFDEIRTYHRRYFSYRKAVDKLLYLLSLKREEKGHAAKFE